MPAVTGTVDAIALLEADHREVDALFREYAKLCKADADDGEKGLLAAQICALLTVHATIEEEIFYPAARAALAQGDLIDEAEVEHATAKGLIAQIVAAEPGEDLYDAKVQVLGEYIRHHVKEEEGEVFPKVQKAKDVDLAALGTALHERKDEAMWNRHLATDPSERASPAK
ncbi:MAG TPA: hemerythrin domain-containing protein [Burkholderiaceae bacterium]|nr:hemerythrin domain-containing protein [Burkholderiaceae bacterium]